MLKTANIRTTKATATGRAIVASAAASVALAFAMVPGVAYAEGDVEELPQGVLTLVADEESEPAITAVETVVSADGSESSDEAIPEGALQLESATGENTLDDSADTEGTEAEGPGEFADDETSSDETVSTDDSSLNQDTPVATSSDDDDEASSNTDLATEVDTEDASTPKQETQEEASKIQDQVEDKSPEDSDIHNNSSGDAEAVVADEGDAVLSNMQAAANELEAMSITSAKFVFGTTVTVTGSGTRAVYTESYIGPQDDYIYDSNGNFYAISGSEKEISWSSSTTLPMVFRNGYSLSKYYVRFDQTVIKTGVTTPKYVSKNVGDTLSYNDTATITFSNFYIFPVYNTPVNYYLKYRNLNGDVNPGGSWVSTTVQMDSPVTAPAESYDSSSSKYNTNTYAGYYLATETDYDSDPEHLWYTVKPGRESHRITETYPDTLWTLFKNANDITTSMTYDEVTNLLNEYISSDDHFFIVASFKNNQSSSISYTVQYYSTDADGKNSNAVGSLETHTDAADTAKTQSSAGVSTPVATGYDVTFEGWANSASRASSGSVDYKAGDAFNASDGDALTLYAVWKKTAQTFKLNYYPTETSGFSTTPTTKSETPSVPDTNASGSTVVAKSASDLWTTRTGYTFLGWATTEAKAKAGMVDHAAGTSLRAINGADVASSTVINLYAVWQDNNYTVNFAANGGSGTISNPYKYAPNSDKLTTMPTLTRDGYSFGGWSENGTQVTDADGNVTAAFKTAATAGTTHNLTAIWTEIQYKINWYTRWNASGPISGYSWQSTIGSTNSSTVLSGLTEATTATPNNTAGDPNYYRQNDGAGNTLQFKGWYLVKTGAAWDTPATGSTALGNSTLAQAISTLKSSGIPVTDTITIYGIWEKLGSATVTYSSNDASFGGQTWNGTVTTTWSDTPFAGDPYVVDGKAFIPGYAFSGRHFVSWNTKADGSGTTYANGDSIANITSRTLYAQWANNTVKFSLNPGASDSSINLNSKGVSALTTEMAKVVKPSDLVTATPTRDNYEFKGWAKVEGGTSADVILGPDDTNTYTITATDASSDGATLKLYAVWEELTYSVSYYANPGTDTTNAVTLKKSTGTQETVTSPYTWTAKTKRSDSGLDQPDIDASRDWYKFEGWSTNANGSVSNLISSTATIGQLLTQAGETTRALKLYAVWTPITFTVKYEAKGSHGTVNPLTETINLATGQNSDVTGSIATADTANGWQLATPTWTDVDGNAVTGSDTTAPQAFYRPTIAYLRTLYAQVPSAATYTFYANFEEQSLTYTVDAYLQQANGTYLTKGADGWGKTFTGVGGTTLSAKLGTTIKATGSGATTVSGFTLAELMTRSQSTEGVSNAYLYTLDAEKTNTDGRQQLIIEVDTTKNVISLYYARTTYDLSASFQTKNASGAVVKNDKPNGATDVNAPSTYLNGGSATTGLRWGQSVTVGTPSTTGYTFAWSISDPASASSTVPGTSFALKAADMKTIAEAAGSGSTPTASLLGTFTVKTVKVTFDDNVANSSHDWTGTGNAVAVASALKTGSYTYTKTDLAYSDDLSGWVPDFKDTNSWDYYFAGWYDAADPTQTTLSKSVLEGMTDWTADKTFKALWLEKLVITYDAGDKDSNGASKAAWATTSAHLASPDQTITVAQTVAKFSTAVSGGEGTDSLPKGAPGWVFDYWTIEGSSLRIGHNAAYPAGSGYTVYPNNLFLNGLTITNGFATSQSYTFVAHWKAAAQTFTVNNAGPIVNNSANTGNASGTLPTGLPTDYVTDQHIVLSDYALTGVENGYELAGWNYAYTPSAEAAAAGATATSGTYGLNDDFYLRPGTTVLTPRFNEKTVTFTYAVAPESNGRGSVNGTATDTVFVVTHNGVTTHTAQVTTADGYSFVNWTLNGAQVEKDGAPVGATLTANDLDLSGVLDSDRTYYANFKVKQYWVRFNLNGTDGTSSKGSVSLDTSEPSYDATEYGFLVDYNTGIPAGAVSITVPEGYELDGWIVNGTGGVEAPSGTAANLQGVYNFKPTTDDIRLTAHFKVSDALKYTVNYVYDPEGISGFSHTETSRVMAWADEVYPQNANAKSPTANGYQPKGWKITYDGTTKTYGSDVADVGNAKFGAIYDKLVADDSPNVDTENKTITIYFMWEAIKYTVVYDFYGNVADDANTANDDVSWTISNYDAANNNVTWNDQAQTFWRQNITRPGYTLDHFTATVTTGSGVAQTSANVNGTDTYGSLATATDGSIYNTITLHAFWKSIQYNVKYDYNYTPAGSSSVRTETKQHGWAEDVDFFTEGAAPTRDGWRFSGWEVHYNGNDYVNHLADITGSTLTAAGTSTIRDLRNGDIALMNGAPSIGDPAVTLKALWVQEASYYFQDALIWADGTSHDVTTTGGRTSATTVAGNSTVNFSSYGYEHGKSTYEGFDFDEHDAATPASPARTVSTQHSATATAGSTLVFRVYYLERTYILNFFANDTDSTPKSTTSNNPYTSATIDLSTVAAPTKAGYTFAGWYLTDGTNRVRIDGTDAKKISDLFTTAPANGSTLRVVADWDPEQVQISWAAGANGSVSSTATSPDTRTANSTAAAAAITATPDSTDYVVEKWTYSYTDADGNVQTGDVTETSEFATLSKSSSDLAAFDILTPKQWSDGLWHNIAFTAHFVTSSALRVQIEYYLEDGDNPGTYTFKESETRADASDNDTYTVTGPKSFDGYTVNTGAGDMSHTYVLSDPDTHTFKVYYDANTYNVTYRYVVSDAQGAATQTDIPTGVGLPTTPYTGMFRTGQTVAVAPVPTASGWTFSGWYKNRATGSVVSGTVSMPADDLEFVGMWERVFHTVRFINDSASGAAADGTTVSMTSNAGSTTGYSVAHGAQVKTSADAVTANATTLTEFGVTANNNNKGWKLSGWKLMDTATGNWLSSNIFGSTQTLDYAPEQDVTFVAQWIETYAVTYDPGMHGAFGAKSYYKIDVSTPPTLNVNGNSVAVFAFFGNDDSGSPVFGADGKPKADLGYEFVGWGMNNGTWVYYFDYDSAVDYGTTVSGYATAALPTTVTGNMDFVAFFKRLPRTVQFMATEYDGTESGADYAPSANFGSSVTTTQSVLTGLYATMLDTSDITRNGYKLDHWTSNGTDSYAPGSTNEFQMGELADGTIVRLYPVFAYDTIEFNYEVATDQGTWGSIDRTKDVKTSTTSTVVGSKATAAAGYEFEKWTLSGSETALTTADGLQSDGFTLIPTAAGTYVAHFKQKVYAFSADKGNYTDAQNVTAPVCTDGTNNPAHWTDSMTLGTPTLTGYNFSGWDVYEKSDYETNGVAGTKLHSGVAAGSSLVSALSNASGTAVELVLVPVFESKTFEAIFNANAGADVVSQMPDDQDNLQWDSTVTTRHADGKPVRAGYTFSGWTVKDAAGNVLTSGYDDASEIYSVLADGTDVSRIVLWAEWTAKNTYSVQFDANANGDTTLDPSKIPTGQSGLSWGSSVITLISTAGADKPTRAGYTFSGWSVYASDGTTLIGDAARVTDASYAFSDLAVSDVSGHESLLLRAVWTPVLNTLTYHLPKGSWSDGTTGDATEQHGSGSDVTPRAKTSVTREGYKLVGWQDADPEGTQTATHAYYVDSVYTADHGLTVTDAFPMPTSNYELWAIWDVMTYTAHFADGVVSGTAVTGGTMPTDPQTVAYDGTVAHAAPTRAGYIFGGWNVYQTSEVENGAAVAGATLLSTVSSSSANSVYSALAGSAQIDEITLIAIWTADQKALSYILTDGQGAWVAANVKDGGPTTLTATIYYAVDTDVTLRAEDTVHRDGYMLVGWANGTNSAEAGYIEYLFDPTTGEVHLVMPSENVRLYPLWELRSYKVTFDGNAPTGEDVDPSATLGNVPNTQPAAGDTLTWSGDKSVVSTGTPTFAGWEFRGWTVYDMNGNIVNNTGIDGGTPLMGSSYNFNVLAGNQDLAERRELKLVANWRLYTYTVVFDDGVNAGDTPIANTLPTDYEGTYNGTVSFHDLVRTGYTFGGWTVTDITDTARVQTLSTVAAGTTSAVYSDLAGSNGARLHLKLTAIWTEKDGYSVTFIGQEDGGATLADISGFTNLADIKWDDEVRVYSNVADSSGKPTRAGYTFGAERTVGGQKQLAGWVVRNTTDPNNAVPIGYVLVSQIGQFHYSQLAMDPTTRAADDGIMSITLTALWTAIPHTVTYQISADAEWIASAISDADPGKANPTAVMNYATDDLVSPLRGTNTAKRAGYNLTGWAWTATADGTTTTGTYDLTGDNPVTSFTMPNADVVLVALWAPKTYTVTFEPGKPAKADPAQTVNNVSAPVSGVKWNDDVNVQVNDGSTFVAPTLAGWEFIGWRVDYADKTGANTSYLLNPTYKFSELALTDTGEHATLNLVAQWKELPYRVIYVDPTDASGAAVTTPAVISNTANTYWTDTVSISDPWTIATPAYAGKSNDDWRFDGWQVLNVTTGEYVMLTAAQAFNILAGYENLTVADVATDADAPALVLYAKWTRRVPFVVDFVKLPVAAGLTSDAGQQVVESSATVKGLDGDDIANVWAAIVLAMGDTHAINGYKYDRTDSAPGMVGKLSTSGDTLHLQLFYKQILDYVVIFDATPGKNASGATSSSKASPAWDTPSTNFVPTDAVWAYTGHRIDCWTYGPTGTEYTFTASEGLTFADIAKAIYGVVDGTEGIADANGVIAKPVTLHAVWVERSDYTVKYDDNYRYINDYLQNGTQVKVDGKFLDRVSDATYTPDAHNNVVWSSTDLAPSDSETKQIVAPGVNGGEALYEIAGWNYSTDGGKTQFSADGMKFSDIVAALKADGSDLDSNEITLYARWKEIGIELKYAPVIASVGEDGTVTIGAGNGGGTVSRASEIVSAVTGGTTSGTKLLAEGATATAAPGYHFYGWRRASDGLIVYAPGMDPSTANAMSVAMLFAQSTGAGFNVLPDGTIEGATLFAAAQNAEDGYWHSEEYQALFVQNDPATLHYDKNADDATGTIDDVTAPYGSLLTLSDGSGFSRLHWTLVSWNTAADGSGTTYSLSQADWPLPEGETTLFAQWALSHYEITTTPDPVGGKVTITGSGTPTVEYGGYLPEGTITATPDDGYYVSGWTYTLVDDDGGVVTGTVDDPSHLKITGKVTFTPVFEKIASDTSGDEPSKAATQGAPASAQAGGNASGNTLPKTGDSTMPWLAGGLMAVAIAALMFLVFAGRRRREEE